MNALTESDYHIGIICALPKEAAAVAAILDEEHPLLARATPGPGDQNTYILGQIHKHNVVIACLPAGILGTTAAATVASNLARTFKNARLSLMVGIGGGIPSLPEHDIRLGDVVVSQPHGPWPGVVQYDMGKNLGASHFERTGSLDKPPMSLLTALATLQAEHYRNGSRAFMYMQEALQKNQVLTHRGYAFPGADRDRLHCACCSVTRWWWRLWLFLWWLCVSWHCQACSDGIVTRKDRQVVGPILHYGTIASGNSLIKDAALRDRLRGKFAAKCVEMEAAGLMNDLSCIVIRGICDYADAYKDDDWQEYAALAAAAFAKELLFHVLPECVKGKKPIVEITGLLERQLGLSEGILEETRQQNKRADLRYESEKHQRCHQSFKTSTYEEFKNYNPTRAPDTCQWVLSHQKFHRWNENTGNDLLWISADPGCGKSVLARSLIENELQDSGDAVCYFFFKDNGTQDHLSNALCAIIHQLFNRSPHLVRHALSYWENNAAKFDAEIDELWRIFLAVATDSSGPSVTCVFDALDECKDADRGRMIRLLKQFYHESFATSSQTSTNTGRSRLKFLVTSRPYSDIQEEFQGSNHLPSIRLRGEDECDQIRNEINLVINLRVQDLALKLNLNDQVKKQLRARLLRMEHRTYLWLYLAFETIKETLRDNLRPDKELIDYLPSSVNDAYEKILSKVSTHKGKKRQALLALQIVVGAHRPLKIDEMAIALGIAISEKITTLNDMRIDENELQERIRQLCGFFVRFNDSRVFLIHQTAKEFLVRKHDHVAVQGSWKHCLSPVAFETTMARICIETLLLRDAEDIGMRCATRISQGFADVEEWRDASERFVVYCATHWAAHFRDKRSPTDRQLLNQVLRLYDSKNSRTWWWFDVFMLGLPMFGSFPKITALKLAILNEHDEVLNICLEDDVLGRRSNDGDSKSELVLESRFECRLASLIPIIETGNVSVQDADGRTALHEASHDGNPQMVEFLLDCGADVDIRDRDGRTALHDATYGSKHETIEFLRESGANVDAQDDDGRTALHEASYEGNYEMVKSLLNSGAGVNVQDHNGRTALHDAVYEGDSDMVKLLLESGADVNAQDRNGRTALHHASYWGRHEMVKLLLGGGDKIHLSTARGSSRAIANPRRN